MSRYRNYDDPIFFTPPTDSPDGRRRLYKGGGGQRDATPEERQLWQTQARYLENLMGASSPALRTGMNNLMVMANEAMSNVLFDRLRSMAEQDSIASAAAAQQAMNKYLAQYGINPNSGAFADMIRRLAVDFAAQRAANMNAANLAADDLKWGRNQNLVSLASGQGATTVSGLGNLASQIGQSRMTAQKLDAEDAMGRGMMSAYVTKEVLGFSDGGPVPSGGGLRYYRPAYSNMPSLSGMTFGSSGSKSSGLGSVIQPIALYASAKAAKPVLAPIKQNVENFFSNQFAGLSSVPTTEVPEQMAMLAAQNAGLTEGASQLGILAAQDAAFLPASQAGSALAAETASALGAEAAGASSALGAVAPVVPWLAAGYALGSLFGLWKDGGAVKAPGMPTDEDTVPALLSNKEYVVNAKAAGLKRRETLQLVNEWKRKGGSTRDLLEKINTRGLVKRYGLEGGK